MTTRNKPEFFDAIASLKPTAKFSVVDDEIQQFEPIDEQPTKEEIDAEMKRLQTEYDTQAYARNREKEYPSIAELTVAMYDEDDKAVIETKRAAVKKKWPKDNSGPVK